jgi:pimeloyl-ACP methyl ester carboxylesterase
LSKLFLIPGLGADSRVYNNIDLPGTEIVLVDWIEPHPTDTLATYAQMLIYHYHITPNSTVIGNSLGGMIAVEMAKLIPLKKIILISSIKTTDEAPVYFWLFRWLPVYKLLPGKLMTRLRFLIRLAFGKMSGEDLWLFGDMLKNTSPVFLKWAMGAMLCWDNKTAPSNVYQIVGDLDHAFPYKKQKGATIIKGGSHIMIYDKAEEINKLLQEALKLK